MKTRTMTIIEKFDEWYDSYDTHPPKSSIQGFIVRNFKKELTTYHKEVLSIVGEGKVVLSEDTTSNSGLDVDPAYAELYNKISKEKVGKLKALAKERGI